MIATPRIILLVALFVLTLGSGVWTSSLGRPLNPAIFAVHKLSALAAVVLSGVYLFPQISAAVRAVDSRTILIAVSVLAALLLLALFASGALLSLERPTPLVALRVHQIAPLLALAALALTVALLAGRPS